MRLLTPEVLLKAYRLGSFPMASDRDDPLLHWLDPPLRGILPLDHLHLPRSLRKTLRRAAGRPDLVMRVDGHFEGVIRACAEPTPERPRTWLNDELVALYCELHRQGHAHSVEVWIDDRLAGGLYGVRIGGAFFGESMFSRERDTSKMALAELVARLRAGGFLLLDTQFLTEHLARLGVVEIPRSAYKRRLRVALMRPATLPTEPGTYFAHLEGVERDGPSGLKGSLSMRGSLRDGAGAGGVAEPGAGNAPGEDASGSGGSSPSGTGNGLVHSSTHTS